MISVKKLYKSFGPVEVLKSVSCEIKKGEKVAIIGPSGSGKSTLLRCMNLLEEPTSGEIWVNGKMITKAEGDLRIILGHSGQVGPDGNYKVNRILFDSEITSTKIAIAGMSDN